MKITTTAKHYYRIAVVTREELLMYSLTSAKAATKYANYNTGWQEFN